MKGVTQTAELNCQEPHLVAIFLPLLPVMSPLETREFQGNITNCFTAQNCTDLRGTSYRALDYFFPRAQGGQSISNNCVPCCVTCNSIKGNKDPYEVATFPRDALDRIAAYLKNIQ